MEPADVPVLSLRGITKSFGGVRVLHGVDLDVRAGEVHALVGENGAGKSTLMKIAAGIHAPDSGEMMLRGAPYRPRAPRDSLRSGLAMVHQELSLAPDVSVAENIFVGREPCKAGLVDWKALHRQAAEWLWEFCLDLDPSAPVGSLGMGYRQVIEILKALASRPQIIIFDEPTSSLEAHETALVLDTIRKLSARSIGVVFISHRLDEVFAVSHGVTVLRDGRLALSGARADLTREAVVSAMVGREIAEPPARGGGKQGAELLSVEELTRAGSFREISFILREGEVLGFSGLVGSGRTELMRAIFGADPVDSGTVRVAGWPHRPRSVHEAMQAGIAYLPEDRKTAGLFPDKSVEENVAAASLGKCSRFGVLRPRWIRELCLRYSELLQIKAAHPTQEAGSLSGGNQQKVLLARLLATSPRVLVVDEPTRGIDVAAKAEIHRMLRDFASRGNGVIVVSSELPELLGICDRILVMREGSLCGEVAGADATEHRLIRLAVGSKGGGDLAAG